MPNSRAEDGLNRPKAESLYVIWGGSQYPVESLDEYTFVIESADLLNEHLSAEATVPRDAKLVGGDESYDIQFRVRGIAAENRVRCGFYDMPIKTREAIMRLQSRLSSNVSDELQTLSYDELAEGNTTKQAAVSKAESDPKQASTLRKAIATIALIAIMLGIVGWIAIIIQTRSTIAVSNSVLVGNYQPVNTPFAGQLIDVHVKVGDHVTEGQTLAVVRNEDIKHDLATLQAEVKRRERDLVAYETQAAKVKTVMEFAKQKADRDMLVARAELQGCTAELKAAQAQVDRLQPLLSRGNIGVFEVESAQAAVETSKAQILRSSALIETLQLAKSAAEKNIMVGVSGVRDPLSEINTKIELAKAAIAEATDVRDSLESQSKPIELTAPQSGVVYAVYRRPGEYLKIAEEAIAISLDEGGWATGHIAPYLATEIRPGQPVEIEIPSMGITANGKVAGVGHRSVYGRGGYNAEFRGGPLEVPIKVEMDPITEQLPSGLRLNMTVRIHDPLATIRKWVDSFKDGETKSASVSNLQ